MRMQKRWRVELFGGLQVIGGGRTITRFRTRKAALLLASLACDLECWHRRDLLIERLWPAEDPEEGRAHLRRTAHLVRQMLEPSPELAGVVLLADRQSLRLSAAHVATDVAEFDAALRSARRLAAPSSRLPYLVCAIDLYRGELLPGEGDDWVLQERQWRAEHYFEALGELVRLLEEGGDFDRAIEFSRRDVRVDPVREEAHRDLIRLLAAVGQRDAAPRHRWEQGR
jgi:DNA-binding SARP family transcriptional activator